MPHLHLDAQALELAAVHLSSGSMWQLGHFMRMFSGMAMLWAIPQGTSA